MSAPIRPSIALAAFAEKFIEGRRVLVFGNATSPFWEELIERGARLVHVCDSDVSRVAEAAARNTSQHVSFAPLSGTALAVREGAFDVGFVDNLASIHDPAQAIHKLKRALSPRGIALVAAPNPDVEHQLLGAAVEPGSSLDYYSLYDLVHREFPVVRMVGQMPFVGYSVAELAPAEEPEPCLDAGFVPGGTEEPEWFVAVASQAETQLDTFVVVQLPHEVLQHNGSERLLREQLRAARNAERNAVERLSRLESEQRRLAEVAERRHKDVDLARQLRLLQEELERKESWILQLEARAATADARADEADQELEELRAQLESHRAVTGKPEAEPSLAIGKPEAEPPTAQSSAAEFAAQRLELEAAEANVATLEQALETQQQELLTAESNLRRLREELATAVQEKDRRAAAQAQLETTLLETQTQSATLERRVAELTTQLGAAGPELEQELERLEAQLVERGQRVRQLEQALAKTERFGAQLIRELEHAKTLTRREDEAPNATELPVATPATGDLAQISNTSWARGASAESVTTTTEATVQSPAEVSAWAEAPSLPVSTSTQIQELREKLDRLAALAARQQADLAVSAWQLEQIQNENQELTERASHATMLSAELSACRAKLQETEVLLAQIRWREATASDNGPVR